MTTDLDLYATILAARLTRILAMLPRTDPAAFDRRHARRMELRYGRTLTREKGTQG